MLEYVINSANVVFLAGCVYAAYLVMCSIVAPARPARQDGQMPSSHASGDHEIAFRKPCADYYI